MESFLATYSLFERGDPPAADTTAHLPSDLRRLLQQVGGNSYANGFFTFVAPDEFRDYLALVQLDASECFPFVKCAFGHLVFYHQKQYKVLNPVFNDVDVAGEDLDFLMNVVLCDRPSMEASFLLDVYEAAFPRLGAPRRNEIYSFTPALGLGGSRAAANVRKAQMAVEMRILLQL